MNEVVERLKGDFQDPDYRHTYDEGFVNSTIATQIKVLREQRKWTQSELAAKAGMLQSRVSEIEDVNYSSWNIRTLRRIAKAFDLRLRVTFEEFGTLLSDYTKLNRKSLERNSFDDDKAFKKTSKIRMAAGATSASGPLGQTQIPLFSATSQSGMPDRWATLIEPYIATGSAQTPPSNIEITAEDQIIKRLAEVIPIDGRYVKKSAGRGRRIESRKMRHHA